MSENKKPRIAEILRVEVGERFSLKSFYPYVVKFWIKSDGTFETEPQRINGSSPALLRAVERPGLVIRLPRWTEQDKEDAEAIRRVFGRGGTVKRYHKAFTEPYSNLVFDSLYINEYLFPSIKAGQEYTLDEIIGGAE